MTPSGKVVLDRLPLRDELLPKLTGILSSLRANTFMCLDCRGASRLPDFPPCVKVIECRSCGQLKELSEMPSTLEVLKLYGCEMMEEDDFHDKPLPASLRELHITSAHSVTRLPETLPPGLRVLNVSNCTFLSELPPDLPSTLEHLDCSFCWRLRPPSRLPPSVLTYVDKEVGYERM